SPDSRRSRDVQSIPGWNGVAQTPRRGRRIRAGRSERGGRWWDLTCFLDAQRAFVSSLNLTVCCKQ
ncbi:MAG: hypothetical protein MET45_20770, partial [Nostoc sp. LLA-1]|nr:hypothetical protein [Cyanocohniella sp. LLY]